MLYLGDCFPDDVPVYWSEIHLCTRLKIEFIFNESNSPKTSKH